MTKINDKFIARHVVEIRLKKRSLSFIDYKGEMGEFMLKKMGWDKLHLTNSRVDIANEEQNKLFFFSWENFGLQIDGAEDFKSFKDYVGKLFKIFEDFKKYEINNIARLGLKSSIFCHRKGASFEQLKEIYKKKMLRKSGDLEREMQGEIIDTGIYALDMKSDECHINMSTGPMDKKEIIAKHFQEDIYSSFKYDSGIFFDIDLSKKDLTVEDIQELNKLVLKGIDSIEQKFNGFLSYLDIIQKQRDE